MESSDLLQVQVTKKMGAGRMKIRGFAGAGIIRTSLLIIGFIMAMAPMMNPAGLAAREIRVKEVKLSLFKKPVTGYRLVIDRHSKFVASRIIKHVSEENAKAFQFEKTIIFENINYPPVTKSKEISLYYLLHNLPGNYTELTVVAMYDYKRSINSQEFPDLSLKLLVDMASMVRKISGDYVKYDDLVFDDFTVENIAQKARERREESISDATVEHFQEEEVENNDVLVKKDPFVKKIDSVSDKTELLGQLGDKIEAVQEKEAKLERREKELDIREAELNDEKEFLEQVAHRNTILKDSLIRLNRKLAALSFSDLTGNEVSIDDAADAVTVLEEKLQQSQAKMIKAVAVRDSLSDALQSAKVALRLKETDNARLTEDIMEMRAANSELRSEYLVMKTELNTLAQSGGNSGSDETLRLAYNQLRAEKAKLESQLERLKLSDATSSVSDASLADSLETYKAQLRALNAAGGDIDGLVRTVTEKDNEIQALEAEKAELEEKLEENVSTLKEVRTASKDLLSQVEAYQERIDELQHDLSALNKDLETNEELEILRDSLVTIRTKSDKLAYNQEQLEGRLRLAKKANESLASKNDSLELQLKDALANAKPLNDTERQKILTARELEAEKKEREIADREKLVVQRENKLEEQQASVDARQKKYEDLEKRENELKKLEQQLRNKGAAEILEEMRANNSGTSTNAGPSYSDKAVNVTRSKVNEFGKYVPVYVVKFDNNYRETEKHVASFMLANGYLYREKFPDLYYKSVSVAGIGTKVDIRFRVEASGSGTVVKASFRKTGGAFIDAATAPTEADNCDEYMRKLVRFLP